MKNKILRFIFYKDGDTLFADNEPLIKGVPARLLLYMLRAYIAKGRSLFFLSELRTNKDLEKFGNLEARLERLAKRLEQRVVGLKLMRQKGCRRLECKRPLSLQEL